MSETTIRPRMRARGLPTAAGAAGRVLAGRRGAGERRGVEVFVARGREVGRAAIFFAGFWAVDFLAVAFLGTAFLGAAFFDVAFDTGRC
ncbi:hypothetical protein [Janibacter limosus]|uniref:hypothetical protein n=1 Tax=Janibacter limosus TaxID=53458 RepID=UPI0012EDF5B3|nr:hypothetical protein [Janibacter limosus]